MKHWRPEDEFVPLQPADRRDWTKTELNRPAATSPGPEPAHVGLTVIAAACFGLVYAVSQSTGFGDSFARGEAIANIPYFGDCPAGGGRNCVVSGDTFDLGGRRSALQALKRRKFSRHGAVRKKSAGESRQATSGNC